MDDFRQVDDMDNGHDMGAIVIDDYDEYDEEYFGEEDGTFTSVEEEKEHVSQIPCTRTTRLSVDTAYERSKENVHHQEETCNGGFDKMKSTQDASDIIEEVEEIEEEEVEEEEEEEEEEGRERFNRTEVGEPRVSALNRLGPRLGTAAPTTAQVSRAASTTTTTSITPVAQACPASGPAAKPIPAKYAQSQCKNIFRRIIIVNNLPPSCTDARIKEVVQSKLRGHVTLDFFDGIYGGCCAVSLSSFTAVPAVVAQLNSVLIADSPLSARLMTMQDHATFWSRKLSCLSVAASGSDANNKWLVVLRNISANCHETWLFKTLRSEVPALINLQYLKESSKNSVSILAFALLPTKQDADKFVSMNDERIVNGKQLVACPYYRGFRPQQNQAKAPALNSSNNAAPANTVPMSAAEQQREMQQRAARAGPAATAANVATPDRDRSPAVCERPAAATEVVVPGPALQLNNHRELLQKSKGANHRVSIHNIAYTVTEDDIIKAVNSKVGGLQFILPFRNNQGCFNGNMLLEFVSPVAARMFHKTMQKFKIKARPIFLKMDTDASRDPQGNIISGSGKPSQFDGPPEMRPQDDGHPVQPPMSGCVHPLPNFGQVAPVVPPLHPIEMGPSRPPQHLGFAPVEQLLGSRLEPMLPPAPLHGLPEPVHETYGLSRHYLDNLNISLPLVPKVLLSNVDPHATENAVGDLLSLAGPVVTVQVNRVLEQAIVEMTHPVEAVEAVSRLHDRIFLDRSIAVRLCRQRDFEVFNGLPVSGDPRAFDMPLAASMESRIPPAIPDMMAINPAFNASASAGLDQRLDPSMAPLHDFRPPMGESDDPLASDDLRARLTRPGNRTSNVPATPRGGSAGRGGYGRGAPNDVPPISGGPGLNGPRGGWGCPSDPGGVISVPFLSSNKGLKLSSVTDSFMVIPDRGGMNPSAAGRGGPAFERGGQNNIVTGRGGQNNPSSAKVEQSVSGGEGGQNDVAASRGLQINVSAGRGGHNVSTARGGQNNDVAATGGQNNVSAARGGQNSIGAGNNVVAPTGTGLSTNTGVSAGRGATLFNVGRGTATAAAAKVTTTVGVGRGAAASPAMGAATNVAVGRGAAASPARGAATNVSVGRGAASNVAVGRGAAASPARGAATNVAVGRGAAGDPAKGTTSNVAVGRGAAASPARGAATNVAVGRGAAASPARGAATNVAVGRGAAASPARGAATNVAVGRGAAGGPARGATSNVPAGRGAAGSLARGAVTNVIGRGAAAAPAGGATTNVAAGRGAAGTPARGAATNVAVGRGAAAGPARGAATNVAVGGGAAAGPAKGVATNVAIGRGVAARGAASNIAVGRGAAASPARGAVSNIAVGRGAAASPARGAASNVAVGRGAVASSASEVGSNIAVGRGAAAGPAKGAASNVAVGRGAVASPARGAASNVAVGRGAAAGPAKGAASNVAVGRGAAASPARGAASNVVVGRGVAASPAKVWDTNTAVGRGVPHSSAQGGATNAAFGRVAPDSSARESASNTAVGRGAPASPARGGATSAAIGRGVPARSARRGATNAAIGRGGPVSTATISSGNVSSPAGDQTISKGPSNVSAIKVVVSNAAAASPNRTNDASKSSAAPKSDKILGAPGSARSVVTGSSNGPGNTLNPNLIRSKDFPTNIKEDQITNSGGTWRTGSLNAAQESDNNGGVKTDSTTGGSHSPLPTLQGIKSTPSIQTTEKNAASLNIWDEAECQRSGKNQRNAPIVDQGNCKKAEHGYNNQMGVGGKNAPWISGHSSWKNNDRISSGDSFTKRAEDRPVGWKRDRAGNAWSDEVLKTVDGLSDNSAKVDEKEPDNKRFKSDAPAAQDSCIQPISDILGIPKSVEDNPYLRSYNQSRFGAEKSSHSVSQDKVAAPAAIWAAGSVPGTTVGDAWNAQIATINPDLGQPPPIINHTAGVHDNVSGVGNQPPFGRDNPPGIDYALSQGSNTPAQGASIGQDVQPDNFKSCYDDNPYLTAQSSSRSSSQTLNDRNQDWPKGSGGTEELGHNKGVARQYEDAPQGSGERSGAGWSRDIAKSSESTRQVANRDGQVGGRSDQYGREDVAPNRPGATNEFSSGQAGFRQTYERRDGSNALGEMVQGPVGYGANNAEVVRPGTDAKGYTGDERYSDRYGSDSLRYGANSRYASNTAGYSADTSRYGADVGGQRAAATSYAGSTVDRYGSNAMGYGANSGAYGASSGAYGTSLGAYAPNSGGYGASARTYEGTSDGYSALTGSQAAYGSAAVRARDAYNQYGAADRGFGPAESTALSRTALFSPPSVKLILNNLPMRVQRKDIVDMCSSYGVVRNIDLDPKEMKCRVLFDNPRDAVFAARELNDRVFRGSTLRALVA